MGCHVPKSRHWEAIQWSTNFNSAVIDHRRSIAEHSRNKPPVLEVSSAARQSSDGLDEQPLNQWIVHKPYTTVISLPTVRQMRGGLQAWIISIRKRSWKSLITVQLANKKREKASGRSILLAASTEITDKLTKRLLSRSKLVLETVYAGREEVEKPWASKS